MNVSVVSAGAGAEHSRIGCLNFSWCDPKRGAARLKQAGRGGIGTVFRDKKIKALVVPRPEDQGRHEPRRPTSQRTAKVGQRHRTRRSTTSTTSSARCAKIGTAHLVEVMDAYDLLPVHNFQYGKHPDIAKIASTGVGEALHAGHLRRLLVRLPHGLRQGRRLPRGAGPAPTRATSSPWTGPSTRPSPACGSNCGIFDPDWILESNFYCDTYGVDTISFGTLLRLRRWSATQRGILNEERTGGLDLTLGQRRGARSSCCTRWRAARASA